MKGNVYLALAAMALTIYLVRLLPFLFLRKPIKNVFFRSFLYYVPYVTTDRDCASCRRRGGSGHRTCHRVGARRSFCDCHRLLPRGFYRRTLYLILPVSTPRTKLSTIFS